MYDMRMQIYGHLQRLDLQFYDRNPVGRLMTRVTTDVDVLNDLFTAGVVSIFGDIFTLLGIMIVLVMMDWRLALLAFSVLPLIVLVTQWFRKNVRESYRTVRIWIARINAFLQEHITGMATVQLFRRERRSYASVRRHQPHAPRRQCRFDSLLCRVLSGDRNHRCAGGGAAHLVRRTLDHAGDPHARVARGVHPVLAALLPSNQRHVGKIQRAAGRDGLLRAHFQAARYACEDPSVVSRQSSVGSPESSDVSRQSSVGSRQSAVDNGHAAICNRQSSICNPRGHILFDHVWFAYNDENYVLKDVSFEVQPGERVGVVGATGSGKTTLINLLLRFYDVTRGRILVDGVDIREMPLDELRRKFSLVLQDVHLFSGTIAENIRLGSTEITDDAVRRAAGTVHANQFIERLALGYDAPVAERGATLSVGQKQLLSFARALAFDPDVLVLDEATSSVDTETEILIRDALHLLMADRTTIAIAHRLSTIQDMDKILVLHKGEVREAGTHQELLAERGIYFKLYQLQYKEQDQDQREPPEPASSAIESDFAPDSA